MLIPQYSLRLLLGIMTVSAVIFSVFAMALRGSLAAAAVSAAILALVVLMLVHAGLFAVVWLISVIFVPLGPAAPPEERPGDDDGLWINYDSTE